MREPVSGLQKIWSLLLARIATACYRHCVLPTAVFVNHTGREREKDPQPGQQNARGRPGRKLTNP